MSSIGADFDVEKTPSKIRVGFMNNHSAFPVDFSQSSIDVEGEAPDSTFRSAYTAPPYPRPQADRDHEQEVAPDRERGDLTAHNLELIPNAEHVAPGIRLDRGGNDFVYHTQGRGVKEVPKGSNVCQGNGDEIMRGNGINDEREEQGVDCRDGQGGGHDDGEREDHLAHDIVDKRSSVSGKTTSSVDATDRSSLGGADVQDDLYEEDDDVHHLNVIHERVGGSGATSENASKGTSVGHFGPRGEAIPGVPPHLDPRQPHFRPPSPGAASVLSVAVHPPASPKFSSVSGLGSVGVGGEFSSSSSGNRDISDSGEETESFENGALTPTLSEEFEDEVGIDKLKLGQSQFGGEASSPTPSPSMAATENDLHSYNFGRLNLGGNGPQVSFSDSVMSYELQGAESLSRTARAPSIAATAGSSRAPSARGLSPPASLSRATTTEGSSLEEYGSNGTGIGESGAETPSIVRSRRSSYSAPSSEVDATPGSVGMELDAVTRARGATLVANVNNLVTSAGESSSSNNHLHDDEAEDEVGGGPSLAPSEAGSDSTRSMTQDSSSLGHALNLNSSSGAIAMSGQGSSDRLGQFTSSPSNQGFYFPGTFETHSFSDTAGTSKGSSLQPVLPSLLAIKKEAGRRGGSFAASTAATAGTASPTSSLSLDGHSDSGAVEQQ